ncbi:molybdopterin-binding protein [Paenibacillus thermoaerophilus]|uniref:Molybdopterin molybdenumtransferase n=1 Tax=Paenibacillus thermoaerophilus TaxID=1215385 RepID=A0ABW2V0D9_9BACL|nr:molybdopterin-binding protein [Paenibacillus thermoaerophilus]
MLREVRVHDAVGLRLAHDLTQIIPGQFKGRLFRKGHVIAEEDIPALLSIGKEHIYVLELEPGELHEDDAALRMAEAVRGGRLDMTEPSEGKVVLKAAIQGLARVDEQLIHAVNDLDEVAMATIRDLTVVEPGQPVVGTRVIPLVVAESRIAEVERLAGEARRLAAAEGRTGPVEVLPFRPMRAGVITTGSEVYSGRIEDRFGPVVRAKLERFGSTVAEQRFVSDRSDDIVREIRYFREAGVDLILVTGGMSVDPDDRTPGAIRQAGARVVSHGTPMLPGSMLMMAYLDDVPIMGLPGSVMHDPYTVFDVLLPRVLAGVPVSRSDIRRLGYGGLHSTRG